MKRNAPEAALIVGQTLDDDALAASGRAVKVEHEVLTLVDVLVVVEPRDVRRRETCGRDADISQRAQENINPVMSVCRRLLPGA